MTTKTNELAPQQYRRIPEYAEAIRYTDALTAGVIAGWVHATREEGISVELVKRGHEHPMRRPLELDRSRGDALETAAAFLILRRPEHLPQRISIGDYLIRNERGGFEVVAGDGDFQKLWQHHSEYDIEIEDA